MMNEMHCCALRRPLLISAVFFVLSTASASAALTGIDLLGEVAQPLIGAAKDKAQGAMKFLWAQPYGGYVTGSGSLTRNGASAATHAGSSDYEGFSYGARGGLELFDNIRLGVDYSRQLARMDEAVAPIGSTVTTAQNYGARLTSWGATLGFDVPKTPLQAFGARYFKAHLLSDPGTGWGGGLSFMLFNPFILMLEYRTFDFKSASAPDGSHDARKLKQYFLGLSFLLL